jgi:hypothetical protein
LSTGLDLAVVIFALDGKMGTSRLREVPKFISSGARIELAAWGSCDTAQA